MSTEITITSTTIDINVTESPITIEAPSGAYPLPTSVYSVFGRTGNVVATEGDYTLTQLAGVTITSPVSGQALVYNGTSWVNNTESYVGTVTSVAITETGDSLNITGSPITTSGTINIGFNGTNLQYVNGAGNLTTFPILTGYVPYTGATQDVDLGAFKLNAQSLHAKGTGGLGHLGLKHQSASATASANEVSLFADSLGDLSWLNGNLYLSKFIISGNTAARSYTFPNANGTVALTSDISYPVTSVFGRTGAVVAAEGDYSLTQLSDVTLTSPANGQVLKYNGTAWVNSTDTDTGITTLNTLTALTQTFATGTSGTDFAISSATSTHTFNLPTASAVNRGALSSADWTTFNNKQNALTNPVTGTGTTNTLSKFTAASTIGNSNISDNGSLITLGSNSYVNGNVGIGSTPSTNIGLLVSRNITGGVTSYALYQNGGIQSDVTTTATFNATFIGTAAASFTVNNVYGYYVAATTIGAGSAISTQQAYYAHSNFTSATNNYGFRGAIPSGTNRWNIFMDGTADNFLAGNTGIGVGASIVSSGPILTTTLTSGGSGYVDATYTDVASTVVSGGGTYALFTIVVSGGIVTTATLTWGGSTYTAGTTLTVSNTLLGGTGSGLVITINTVDSSQLYVASATGGDINLFRSDTSLIVTDNIGSIKWNGNDGSTKASGISAKLSAFAAGSAGGAYLSFFTSTGSGGALTEQVRIGNGGQVGIGGAYSLTGYSLRVSKNITGAVNSFGIASDGEIQSGVTTSANLFYTSAATAATTFTLTSLNHFAAVQGTFGAGSTVTNQYGFIAGSSLTGATNNYGFYGNIASGTNRWNLYMAGTAANYMAGDLGLGTTTIGAKLHIKTALSTASSEEIALRVESTPTGGTADRQIELVVKNDGTAANTYGIIRLGDWFTNTGTPSKVLITASGASYFTGGAVSIGTTSVNASAALQIDSTTQGFLPPRMTTTQKNAIATPATGLVVFDSTLGKLCVFSTTWQTITSV